MTQTETCPADGCDYSGLPDAVAGHYGGKRDEAHSGNYSDAMAMLEGGASTPSDEGAGESQEGGSDGNPLKQGPESEAGSGHADDHAEETPSCPSCGTPSGMSPDDLEDGAHYKCEACGEVLQWRDDDA